MRIPIAKPEFGERELELIRKPLETGWVGQGPWVSEFESRFGAGAVAVSSGTAGLHLSLQALGIGPGDEVVVPAFTWVSCANAVEHLGARPVFCDIDLTSYNFDPSALVAAISPRTRAIMPVHLFGLACRMDAAMEAASRGAAPTIRLIEDAACALGTTWNGKQAGTIGDLGVYSFHPRKIITTGEGGIVIGNDREALARIRSLREHGASVPAQPIPGELPKFEILGYNYRMTDLQGALGVAQMERLSGILSARRVRAERYLGELGGIPGFRVPTADPGHSWQAFVCRLELEGNVHEKRNRLMALLELDGISTRPGTHAPPLLDFYSRKYGYSAECYPNASKAERTTVALPLYPSLTDAEQVRVIERVRARLREL